MPFVASAALSLSCGELVIRFLQIPATEDITLNMKHRQAQGCELLVEYSYIRE